MMLRHLLHLQKELMLRKLTPEVAIYRRWLAALVENEIKMARTRDTGLTDIPIVRR